VWEGSRLFLSFGDGTFEMATTPKKQHSFADSENRTSSHGIVMYVWYRVEALANPKMNII
jgi:hypothetical protein